MNTAQHQNLEQIRSESSQIEISIPQHIHMSQIVGLDDEVLDLFNRELSLRLIVRGNKITAQGAPVELECFSKIAAKMIQAAARGESLSTAELSSLIDLQKHALLNHDTSDRRILTTHLGKHIAAKTQGQQSYVDAIRSHTVTFGLGPAGSGKTYLAMALALDALNKKEIGRIILSRPIVEAGENLGFLPGSIEEKVDPYLRPLYDALFDMCSPERAQAYLEGGSIEIAPLAFMRGRTFNDAFVILDEAQNTTPEQMKMFLTRLGFNSKFVVTGDESQVDLPKKHSSLKKIEAILKDIDDIAFIHLGGKDVIRHKLVAQIVRAYERNSQEA